MQGLADGYFVLPYTIGDYLAPLLGQRRCPSTTPRSRTPSAASTSRTRRLLSINGNRTVDDIHRELGKVLWDNCGMARSRAEPQQGALGDPRDPRGVLEERPRARRGRALNQSLEKAGRVADFLEFGELHVPRRAAPQRELRRPLPRGVPDRRGRGEARRRALRVRRRVGVHRRRQRARAAQGAARVRVRRTRRPVRYK